MKRHEEHDGFDGAEGADREAIALTAYALGELDGDERSAVEARLERDDEARAEVDEIRELAAALTADLRDEEPEGLDESRRARVAALAAPSTPEADAKLPRRPRRRWWFWAAPLATAAGLIAVAGTWFVTDQARHAELSARIEGEPYTYTIFGGDARPAGTPRRRAAEEQLRQLGYVHEGVDSGASTKQVSDLNALGYTDASSAEARALPRQLGYAAEEPPGVSREAYDRIVDNPFRLVRDEPLSTFSIDVDTASYSNVRRMLNEGRLPPPDAVRIEELVNYFSYDYPPPLGNDPFSVDVEVAGCPWSPEHRLVRIGLNGREADRAGRLPRNLVFLIDVSGSMGSEDKLPLVQRSLAMLVAELEAEDRVAIVVYAGSSGVLLESTPGSERGRIRSAIERLGAGGSTHGSAGIVDAYRIAEQNFVEGGVNRVILASDGDFNVGVTDRGSLTHLIEEKAESGVFLTVLGYGTGNLQDAAMEQLADRGNGNYAYVDTLAEARKVLVHEMEATLVTIAKDVKIQVELNPLAVEGFRLIGYENRALAHEDFNDDRKDAGEIGSGHTVTALYEIVPRGGSVDASGVDPLRYQEPGRARPEAASGELLTVKLRYKEPDGDTSRKLELAVRDGGASWEQASADFHHAASVAAFGMCLRGSAHRGDAELRDVLRWAELGAEADPFGYRAEYIRLVRVAWSLRDQLPDDRDLRESLEDLGYTDDR